MADEELPNELPRRLAETAEGDESQPTTADASRADETSLLATDGEYLLAEQGEPAETAGSKRRNRTALAVVAGVLGLILIAAVAIIGYYAKSANDALNQVERQPSMLPTESRPPSPTPVEGKKDAPVNVLIMGSDSRGEGDQGRSDVMMLAHVSGDRKSVYLISFPRDMWVNVPGRGMAKINAAYAWGGMSLSVQTVEELTGAHIDHAAMINFEGFVQAIDSVGGVEVYNHVASSSNNFTFPEGRVQLNGESGLVYTRERYNLPNGDLDRARRQREVMLAVVKKMLTPEVLADPAKFNNVVNTMAPFFVVDESFTNAEMTKLALSMRITEGSALRPLQAPLQGFGTSADGQSIDIVSQYMVDLGLALRNDDMQSYWDAHRNDPPLVGR